MYPGSSCRGCAEWFFDKQIQQESSSVIICQSLCNTQFSISNKTNQLCACVCPVRGPVSCAGLGPALVFDATAEATSLMLLANNIQNTDQYGHLLSVIPKKCPFPWGGSGPHVIYGSLDRTVLWLSTFYFFIYYAYSHFMCNCNLLVNADHYCKTAEL